MGGRRHEMSRSLTMQKEEVLPFIMGMLVMFLIFWLFTDVFEAKARSLPCSVACDGIQDKLSVEFTERKLKSVPIEPPKVRSCEVKKELDTPPIICPIVVPPICPAIKQSNIDNTIDRRVEQVSGKSIVTGEGDETVPTAGTNPLTERSAEIESTVSMTDATGAESGNSQNEEGKGRLVVELIRKY